VEHDLGKVKEEVQAKKRKPCFTRRSIWRCGGVCVGD
jgi:hypothetical protein